ncbi:hypothetical protein B296_00056920 [Ensete ventricosum]|uniref:Uncharacterized protein n=1 Tax=Ensete ventricosum TaxID=4639 RepID=A0A426WXH1_ENSVE|nr:hypothetical protein B296_00056920 [Ensete ventricosum]
MKDKGHSLTSHVEAYSPLYYHSSSHTKNIDEDELRERSTKGFYSQCDEPWSREHHCKKSRLLMIEPVVDEDNEPSKEALEHEEAIEEESEPTDYVMHALADYPNPQMMKARQPYTLMAAISFARIQEEQLNHEVRKTRVAPRLAMSRPTAPSTAIQASTPKKLTRDELRERSAKGLCWHCDESWSR